MNDKTIKEIVHAVGKSFRCFGGGNEDPHNPISMALAKEPLQFAAGVDVEDIVRFILSSEQSLGNRN